MRANALFFIFLLFYIDYINHMVYTIIRGGKKGVVAMTTAQERKIEYIKKSIIATQVGERYAENYEFKEFKVYEEFGKVFISISFGRKNDENTMAQIYCRYYAFLSIGKRGAMEHYKKDKWTRTKYLFQAITIL